MNTLIIFGASIISLVAIFFLRKKERGVFLAQKIAVIVFLLLVNVNYLFNDSFLSVVNGGWQNGVYYNSHDYLETTLRLLNAVSFIILPLAVFGKGRFYKNVAILYCLPVSILYAFFYKNTMDYYLTSSTIGGGYVIPAVIRHIFFSATFIIQIILPVSLILVQKHLPRFKSFEPILAVLILPLLIVLQMPPYIPQSIFGYVLKNVKDYQVQWISVSVIIAIALILAFRFKDRQTRLEVAWLLTLCMSMYYNSAFLMGYRINRLPLQLCNLASYLTLFVMITRSSKFFNFVFLANVTGTIIAMILAEAAEPKITYFYAVRYMYQHSLVLIVPCVIMGLRIFPRLNGSAMIHAAIGFTAYWTFCLFFGGYVNSNPEKFNHEFFNLFYLFDVDIIRTLAPWAVKTFTEVEIFGITLRPIVQLLVLLVFYGLTCLLFLLTINIYKFTDDHLLLRRKLIEVIEKKTGKRLKLPLEFKD